MATPVVDRTCSEQKCFASAKVWFKKEKKKVVFQHGLDVYIMFTFNAQRTPLQILAQMKKIRPFKHNRHFLMMALITRSFEELKLQTYK